MEYQDKSIKCKECGNDFVFTAGDQAFYAMKGFENTPARCRDCRTKRNEQFRGKSNGGSRPKTQLFDDVCDACHQAIQVPFRRTGTKPVYCRDCREKINAGAR